MSERVLANFIFSIALSWWGYATNGQWTNQNGFKWESFYPISLQWLVFMAKWSLLYFTNPHYLRAYDDTSFLIPSVMCFTTFTNLLSLLFPYYHVESLLAFSIFVNLSIPFVSTLTAWWFVGIFFSLDQWSKCCSNILSLLQIDIQTSQKA